TFFRGVDKHGNRTYVLQAPDDIDDEGLRIMSDDEGLRIIEKTIGYYDRHVFPCVACGMFAGPTLSTSCLYKIKQKAVTAHRLISSILLRFRRRSRSCDRSTVRHEGLWRGSSWKFRLRATPFDLRLPNARYFGVCFLPPYGTTSPTSDYDVGLIGKDSGLVAATFNTKFEEPDAFGKPSELVFDTNIYGYSLEYSMPSLFVDLSTFYTLLMPKLDFKPRYQMLELAGAYVKLHQHSSHTNKGFVQITNIMTRVIELGLKDNANQRSRQTSHLRRSAQKYIYFLVEREIMTPYGSSGSCIFSHKWHETLLEFLGSHELDNRLLLQILSCSGQLAQTTTPTLQKHSSQLKENKYCRIKGSRQDKIVSRNSIKHKLHSSFCCKHYTSPQITEWIGISNQSCDQLYTQYKIQVIIKSKFPKIRQFSMKILKIAFSHERREPPEVRPIPDSPNLQSHLAGEFGRKAANRKAANTLGEFGKKQVWDNVRESRNVRSKIKVMVSQY
ncbi:Hypothetical predicted protein, partial [Paramuricea clavata]